MLVIFAAERNSPTCPPAGRDNVDVSRLTSVESVICTTTCERYYSVVSRDYCAVINTHN